MQQSFDDFMRQWIGQRVADPTLAGELPPVQWYQCVSVVKQYLRQCYGIEAGYWGDADAYWTIQHPEIQAQFDYVPTQEVQKGDITPLTRTHIGIATGNVNSSQFEMLEQNGATGNGSGLEGDAIRTRWLPKSRILGVLRPRVTEVPVQPPAPRYTVVETYDTGKQIQLNKQPTYLWGMNYDFDFMKDNPVETHNAGEVWTVTNKVHHQDGYDYYRRDGQIDGFNVLDCDDYTPPPPPPPAPYVPPAAPLKGTLAETYEIFTTLPTYDSADAVAKAKNPTDIIQSGKYYVWAKAGSNNNYWELSTSNSKNDHSWINIVDNKKPLNVPTPKPEPVTITLQAEPTPPPAPVETTADILASWKWFYKEHDPVEYLVAKDYLVRDIVHTGKPIQITAGKTIEIYGTFKANGRTYLRPLTAMDERGMYNFYGIPTTDWETGAPYLENIYDVKDKILYGIDAFIDKSVKTIEGIYKWVRHRK